MIKSDERLALKVQAVNAANAYANGLAPCLAEIFAPLVGQKVTKADGTLLAKVAKLLPKLPNTVALSVHRYESDYSLAFKVKACAWTEGANCYHETMVYVVDLRNGVLTGMCKQYMHRTDYTADEVRAKRAAYEAAKKAADDARSDLHPFGEYDH